MTQKLEIMQEAAEEARRILTKAENLVIVIQNTCSKELEFDCTQKGIGLSSIVRSTEKYGGMADFKSNNGIFTSRIVL